MQSYEDVKQNGLKITRENVCNMSKMGYLLRRRVRIVSDIDDMERVLDDYFLHEKQRINIMIDQIRFNTIRTFHAYRNGKQYVEILDAKIKELREENVRRAKLQEAAK